ncbi:hypothetical protein K435DRAFT_73530 [Dendrothele bispora CBS 962.96]|uniref:Uncharacterized protein n=1 Tax=Dendrothele bispora (strain CBS 962.96) TaxID=1314807 RepID=A0A4S8KQG2_DENBC|nr:hypothetical protein K435DRAFT_73530 [Dendrothele bispora CBS 962.96]
MDSLPTENVLPLTHMFKRSLSEPASGKRVPYTTPGSEEEGFTEQEQAGEQGNPSNVVLSVGPGTIDFYTDRGSGGGGSGGGNGQESSSSTTGSVWPSLSPLSVPAHAASVPEAHPSPRAVPPNTQRAYTHPDLHLQAHINRPFQPSITHPQSYAPFASSPLSLSPGSISPPLTSSSFPSVSSLSPISPPTIQYGFPSTTTVPYTGGQIHELNQSQYHYPVVHGHQHHHQPGHVDNQDHIGRRLLSVNPMSKVDLLPGPLPGSIDSSMSEMGFPGPGQGAGQSTRTIRTSVSHSHLRGSYREDYQIPHQRPPLTPSPRSPSTPELQQQQQNARSKQETAFSQNRNQGGFPSYAHTSSFSFPRRGSIAFPIGSSSTSRPSDSDIGTMGSSVTGGGKTSKIHDFSRC